MNMKGVFLHVLGDAIGNVGVIFVGAFILFTHYSWRHYADPVISFIIACIIFQSALPLVKSASFILLQGVPTTVSLGGVRDSVLRIEGVLSVHDLHVWQLNENKNVASLHIMVDCSGEQRIGTCTLLIRSAARCTSGVFILPPSSQSLCLVV